MTTFRLMSLPMHGAFELLLGFALLVAPFAFGFALPGAISAIVVGALVVGLALSAAVSEDTQIDVAAHHAYDFGIAFGLIGAAIVLALAGDGLAGPAFAFAAVAQLTLNLTTRYSTRR